MRQRYGCICFAVPKKLLAQLADDDDPEHGKLLRGHVDHSSSLRAQRAVQSQSRPEPKLGKSLLARAMPTWKAGAQTVGIFAFAALYAGGVALLYWRAMSGLPLLSQ